MISGRYRIDDALGSGGMGKVWRGWDTSLQRPVAVKEVVIPHNIPEKDAQRVRDRYIREARAAARLQHTNVVGVYDMVPQPPAEGEPSGGRIWTVMELVKGRDLSQIMAEYGTLPPLTVARIGVQLLAALGAAHRAGVLHRDMKPANVLVCDEEASDTASLTLGSSGPLDVGDRRVVLTDFGIASIAGDPSLTKTGQLVGSPSYIPPERLTAGGVAGEAGDLWALGCTLYAAIEGEPPYHGDDPFAVLAAITTEQVPPPRNAGPLTSTLRGLLQKDPNERWDLELAAASLQRIVSSSTTISAGMPETAEPTVRLSPRPSPTPKPQRTMDRPSSRTFENASARTVVRPQDRPATRTVERSHPTAATTAVRRQPTGRLVRPRRIRLMKTFGALLIAGGLVAIGIALWGHIGTLGS